MKKEKKDNEEKITRCSTIDEWNKKTIPHVALQRVLEQIRAAMEIRGTDDNLIVLSGPTGAGKSTVRKYLTKQILEEEKEAMKENLGYLPVVALEVFKTPEKSSQWRNVAINTLKECGDPLPDKKRVFDPAKAKTAMSQPSKKETTDGALNAIINQFNERHTKLYIADEAHHALLAGMGRTERENIETFKSIANATQTKILLIGPYDLTKILRQSGQLGRRAHEIHFGPYGNDESEDFLEAADNLMAHLPVPVSDSVSEDLLMVGSLRCVGLLKHWLHRAALRARRLKRASISEELLSETRYSAQKLETFISEMQVGEHLFCANPLTEDNIRRYLALPVEVKEKVKPKAGKTKPGERAPGRDDI